MANENSDFYAKLRNNIREWSRTKEGKANKWVDYLLFAPDLFHLLCKLMIDADVPAGEKVKLTATITYFISPLDLIPEAIVGPAGYVDDIALAAYVLNGIINNVDPSIVQRHWAGDADVLKVISRIIQFADSMVGAGLWRKIRQLVKSNA